MLGFKFMHLQNNGMLSGALPILWKDLPVKLEN